VYPLVGLDLIIGCCRASGLRALHESISIVVVLRCRFPRKEKQLSKLFRRETKAKVFAISIWVDGEWRGCGKQFDEGDSRKDKGCSDEGTAAKMLVQNEEGGQAGKDWFECEEDGGVGRGKVLLGPALYREGSRGGEEASHDEGNEQARSDGEVGPSA
jgi:hypothetical protein